MTYASEVLADTPVAFWPFDEGTGTALVDDANAFDGSLAGGTQTPAWTADSPLAGGTTCLAFATNDYAGLTTLGTFGQATGITIEFWIKSTQATLASVLGSVATGTGLILSVEINSNGAGGTVAGALSFIYRRTAATSVGLQTRGLVTTAGILDGAWHHVAITANLATQVVGVWIDGASRTVTATTTATGTFAGNYTHPVTVGGRNVRGSIDQFLTGRVSHLAVYDHVLTGTRIVAHHHAATSGPSPTAGPVDLTFGFGTNSLELTGGVYLPAPIDLPLEIGDSTFRLVPEWHPTPIDLPLTIGDSGIEQTVYNVAPLDLVLGLGTSLVVFPIRVSVPTVLASVGVVEGRRLPPIVEPGQPVPVDVELRRGGTKALLGRFRTAVVARTTWTWNGIGEALFSWVPRPALEPDVTPHLVVNGEPQTWLHADLEVWIYRAGRLVFAGPVVWQRHDPRSGRLTVRCWSREGYVRRLDFGTNPRTNLFPRGEFTGGTLPGWTGSGASLASVTSPLYRRPRSMRISATGARPKASASFTLGPFPRLNVVTFLVTARYESGTGWEPDPSSRQPLVGRIIRTILDPATGDPLGPPDIYPLTAEATTGTGQWVRASTEVRREVGRINHYRIETYGVPGGVVHVGEVEAYYTENIGAYAGDGRRFSAWVAALGEATVDALAGADWTYDVGPAGPVLISSKRTPAHDHPKMWSLWEDATVYGDWWCPVAPERVIRYRARRGRHVPELRIVGRQVAGDLATEWDGAHEDAANTMVLLADGMSGPAREEGRATSATTGASLHRTEMAPPGTLPRDLDLAAAQLLDDEGGVRRTVTAAHAMGPAKADAPTRRTWPGAWLHMVEPGDWTELRQVDGALDYLVTIAVRTMEWDVPNDRVAFSWVGNDAPS